MTRAPEAAGLARLERAISLPGAVLLGLGSILGTGVFVGLANAAGLAGERVLMALVLAAALAAFNGLSSAELAARFPISGGTYEYAHRTLTPSLGFAAGWLFLCAKTASCATAALGAASYALHLFEAPATWLRPVAVASVVVVTALCTLGLRRTNAANAVMVGLTLVGLALFAAAGLTMSVRLESFGTTLAAAVPTSSRDWELTLTATASLFVAYTGYGRIATLGEEVKEPARTVPRAVVVTLLLALMTYLLVALAALGAVGAERFAAAAAAGDGAPLARIAAAGIASPLLAVVVAVASVTAMLGVQLNLVLGLSRVVLAMARRGDAPKVLAQLSTGVATPRAAVMTVGIAAAVLAGTLDFKTSWSFSAFTVLVYYALTNLAALRLPPAEKTRHPLVAFAGLAACLALSCWIELQIAMAGAALVALGFALRALIKVLPAIEKRDI